MRPMARIGWIDYHLGVDGLGALMLVLSALVTLMSMDAAHRVHSQPNLYFTLVLMLESGLFGTFTALNFFHWFLFWELSLIPAFFLIKLWGGPSRSAAATPPEPPPPSIVPVTSDVPFVPLAAGSAKAARPMAPTS